jgi:hypothetical protein
MHTARAYASAGLLHSGQVLVAGGRVSENNKYLASTEIYNPATNVWLQGPALPQARSDATAVVLSDGRVLLAGGHDNPTNRLGNLAIYQNS